MSLAAQFASQYSNESDFSTSDGSPPLRSPQLCAEESHPVGFRPTFSRPDVRRDTPAGLNSMTITAQPPTDLPSLTPERRASLERLFARIGEVATLPASAQKLLHLTDDENADADDIREAIQSDPVLVARLLRRLNSSYYSLSNKVSDLKTAVALLGLARNPQPGPDGVSRPVLRAHDRPRHLPPRKPVDAQRGRRGGGPAGGASLRPEHPRKRRTSRACCTIWG